MPYFRPHPSYIAPIIVLFLCTILALSFGSFREKPKPFTIVLDAGHGGKDSGAQGQYVQEKDIALQLTLQLGYYLEHYLPQVQVLYTRKSDVFIPLHERVQVANANQADVFFSIHCNSLERRNKDVQGTETFVMGLHRAEDNLLVAKRENKAILLETNYNNHYAGYDPHSSEGHIMLSMYQNAHLTQSLALAGQIEQQFANTIQRRSRGVKQAGFLVLRETTMPAVLVETGFLSNNQEEYYLSSQKGQAYIASAMFRALQSYFHQVQQPENKTHQWVKGQARAITATEPPTTSLYSRTPTNASIVYKIQLAAATNKPSSGQEPWASIGALEYYQVGKRYKYLVGNYPTKAKALASQAAWRRFGFVDAFIVAFKDGQLLANKGAS
ncbi:MAG: N-acetylmuramoyl-L-alanine amidase family protein [Aureispira sp.]